jgi:hypothetical protein
LFVFLNKRSTRAKVLWWDTNGYCLLCKRLHQALFVMPSTPSGDSRDVSIDGRALAMLLAGVEKRRRGPDGWFPSRDRRRRAQTQPRRPKFDRTTFRAAGAFSRIV